MVKRIVVKHIMLRRIALLGLFAAGTPDAAKAWGGCYFAHPCHPRFYSSCYGPCDPRYPAWCRWCGGYRRYALYPYPRVYARAGGGFNPYDGSYYRWYHSERYDGWRPVYDW